MAARKKATRFIIDTVLKALFPEYKNAAGEFVYPAFIAEYEAQLNALSDEEFKQYMLSIKNGDEYIRAIVPNAGEYRINVENALRVADNLSIPIFQHLVLTDPQTGTTYTTPKKYMVIDLPVRRQAQMLKKKQSIPEDDKHHDQYTDQATGVSKGAKISFPEIQILAAQKVDTALRELISFRGGDMKAYNAMKRTIYAEGGVSHAALSSLGTRVKSIKVFSAYLKAMHLDNNL